MYKTTTDLNWGRWAGRPWPTLDEPGGKLGLVAHKVAVRRLGEDEGVAVLKGEGGQRVGRGGRQVAPLQGGRQDVHPVLTCAGTRGGITAQRQLPAQVPGYPGAAAGRALAPHLNL